MFSNILAQYLGGIKEYPGADGSQLRQFIEESRHKLGITQPVKLLHSDSELPNLMMSFGKDAAGRYQPSVLVTEGARRLLSGEEIKAVIGHELSHAKDGLFMSVTARKLPLFALPVAFASSYYILDQALCEQHKEGNAGMTLQQAVSHVVSEDIAAVKKFVVDDNFGFTRKHGKEERSTHEQKAVMYETVVRAGGCIAAAAAGLAVGAGVARHLSLSSEFRADRIGAMLAGKPEAMSSAVNKLMKSLEEQATKGGHYHGSFITTSPNVDTVISRMLNRVKTYIRNELAFLDLEFMHAHPTTSQRIKALHSTPKESFTRFAEKAAGPGTLGA